MVCGVLCGCGLRLAWVWFVVFDVGVVWMGGSVLGPVWVRVCLAVCAFGESGLLENEPTAPAEQAHTARFPFVCCFGGEF